MAQEKKEFKSLFDAVTDLEVRRQTKEKKDTKRDAQSEEMKQGEKMHDEISLGLEHAFRFNDVTPSQFRAYISRPQNFSDEEWKALQKQKKQNDEMIKTLQERINSPAFHPPQETQETSEIVPEEIPQKKKIKKSSTLSRRDWLNMH